MRGSEISLNLPEMKRWTPLTRLSDTMQIKAMDNGELVLGVELRKSMTEKMQDMWKVEVYATDDMKVIVMQPNKKGNFKFPKNGRRAFKEYVSELKSKGYKIPAIYDVEWNEAVQAWVGVLQEVAERPVLVKRGRKNGK